MNIVFIVSSLTCGGAERVVILTAGSLLSRGHKVSLITIAGKDRDFYQVPDGVDRIALNLAKKSPTKFHALWNNLHRFRVVRKTISSLQPDVVISHMCSSNILTLISLVKTKYPVIATEHNDPKMSTNQGLWRRLRRLVYPMAVKIVSVSEGVDLSFNWLAKEKRTVIYNPIQPINDEQVIVNLPKGVDPNKKFAVAMGRLHYQKNFELLLSAFNKIVDKHPNWQLLIFGEGELRTKLERIVEDLGLQNKVFLPGLTNKPTAILKESELFILSSRFEGLPLVLLEALACGLPVISTDCPSGPREVIQDGIDGVLVKSEDISALAEKMDRLMSDETERRRLAQRAPEAANRFSLDNVTEKWELLLNEVTESRLEKANISDFEVKV